VINVIPWYWLIGLLATADAASSAHEVSFRLLPAVRESPKNAVAVFLGVKNVGSSRVVLSRERVPIVANYTYDLAKSKRDKSERLEDIKTIVKVATHNLLEGERHCSGEAQTFALEPGNEVLLSTQMDFSELAAGSYYISANVVLIHAFEGLSCFNVRFLRGRAETIISIREDGGASLRTTDGFKGTSKKQTSGLKVRN
jgi:hypothetical protein